MGMCTRTDLVTLGITATEGTIRPLPWTNCVGQAISVWWDQFYRNCVQTEPTNTRTEVTLVTRVRLATTAIQLNVSSKA